MKVILIGAGNVAVHFGRALVLAGVTIPQVYNRSQNGLKRLASITKARTTSAIDSIEPEADLYLIAVSDDGIAEVAASLSNILPQNTLVAHTSGSTSIQELTRYFRHSGVLYPLQSLQKDRPVDFDSIPLFVTGSSSIASSRLFSLAQQLSTLVTSIEDDQRMKLHVPAVVVNNFVNHFYALTYDYCQKENLDIASLFPLMSETLSRVTEKVHPAHFQTGPAVRNDQKTIKRHRQQLKHHTTLLRMYNYITRSIRNYHENR